MRGGSKLVNELLASQDDSKFLTMGLTLVCRVFGYRSSTRPFRLFSSSPMLLATAQCVAESSKTKQV